MMSLERFSFIQQPVHNITNHIIDWTKWMQSCYWWAVSRLESFFGRGVANLHCKGVVFVLMSLRYFEFVICIRFISRNLLWFWLNAADEASTLEIGFDWWMTGSVALRCCDERFSENQRWGKVNKFLALYFAFVNSSWKIDTNCESCAIEWNRLINYGDADIREHRCHSVVQRMYDDIHYDDSGAFRCPYQLRNIIHWYTLRVAKLCAGCSICPNLMKSHVIWNRNWLFIVKRTFDTKVKCRLVVSLGSWGCCHGKSFFCCFPPFGLPACRMPSINNNNKYV